MADGVRNGLLVRTCLEVLRDSGERMPGKKVLDEAAKRINLTDVERRPNKDGTAAWINAAGFGTGDAATIGWLVKRDNLWSITDAGRAALDTYLEPEAVYSEIGRRYREIDRSRKQARAKYDDRLELIASALEVVPAGSWTAYDDLADLVEGSADEIAHLLAAKAWKALENSHRVLQVDGRVPEAMYQHVKNRGGDLRKRLLEEGVEFNGAFAHQEQRIAVEFLRERIAETAAPEGAARRAWLVRGSNVEGIDLVPIWLDEAWISLAASQLPELETGVGRQRLREVVAETYRHKSYSVREKLLAQFDAFLLGMRPDDYLMTVHRGAVYLGLVNGPAYFAESSDRRSNLRRSVRWLNLGQPHDLAELPGALPTLTQSQDDLIDLTDALDAIERLYADLVPEQPVVEPIPEARLADVTAELADELLTDLDWLRDVAQLLGERRQMILYGPPGTGKTYLAQRLAARLTEPHAVKLIQFHPSYTYEDFFEGFRPSSGVDGTLRFKLTSGPLRKLADDAREHPSTAYVLIIDEINRGNLAKIFGELYFLLEYRDQRIRLQYSQDDFTLPRNLYLIGTMNTADRSIAPVDAAMRRRFAFVELHPTKPPVAGLLHRWLDRVGISSDAPDLLDALNNRLADADYAVGPSYFMRESLYAQPDGLDRVWRWDLLPLLVEHHYADDIDVWSRYGLDELRRTLPTGERSPAPERP